MVFIKFLWDTQVCKDVLNFKDMLKFSLALHYFSMYLHCPKVALKLATTNHNVTSIIFIFPGPILYLQIISISLTAHIFWGSSLIQTSQANLSKNLIKPGERDFFSKASISPMSPRPVWDKSFEEISSVEKACTSLLPLHLFSTLSCAARGSAWHLQVLQEHFFLLMDTCLHSVSQLCWTLPHLNGLGQYWRQPALPAASRPAWAAGKRRLLCNFWLLRWVPPGYLKGSSESEAL